MTGAALVVALGCLGVATSAAAQDDVPEEDAIAPEMTEEELDDAAARQHFVAARGLYDIGRFDEAANEFQEAYRLSERPELLYNVYVAHRDAGHRAEATAALRQYLTEMPDAPDRVNLQARLEALEAQLAEEEAAAEREAELQARADAAERERRARESSATEPQAAFQPLPWVVAGVGGLAMIGGAIFGIAALSATGDIEDECPNNLCPASYADFEADRSAARTLVALSDWMLLGGGVVLAAGVVWGLLTLGGGEPESASADVPAVSAACGATGCMGTMRMGF